MMELYQKDRQLIYFYKKLLQADMEGGDFLLL